MANFNIDYLVIAGGGGGGPGYQAGGGGAGGMRTSFGTGNVNGGLTAVENSLTLATATSYTVQVGAAGSAGVGTFPSANRGGTGGDSEINGTGITTITSQGGGGGASYNNYNQGGLNLQGSPGGSGGGSAPHGNQQTATGGVRVTNPIQGFDGGDSLSYATPYYGAGGGGAGGLGGVSNGANTGLGGLGLQNDITVTTAGTGPYYAGGGGGGAYYSTGGAPGVGGSGVGGNGGTHSPSINAAGAGATNTGSGGGGGGGNGQVGGAGGSGIVILRYATADVAGYTTTGSTPTEDTTTITGQTILSFTTVGTGTITFTALPPPTPTPFDGTRATTPVTGFNKTGTSEGLKLPSGDNSNQPVGVLAEQGMIRNDTEETVDSSASAIAHYNGTAWQYFAATESPDVVYPTSLKMYLDASNTTSYPGNGTTWFDLTSNANNGTINGAFWNPGGYFDFDGSSDYINVPDNNSLEWTTSKSLSVWVNSNNSSGNKGIVAKTTNASPYGWILQQDGGNVKFWFASGGNFPTTPATTLPLNTWTHIAVTYNGSSLLMYKNGVLVSTLSTSLTPALSSSPLTIGRYYSNISNYYFNGQTSKVRIYDVVLTQAEITALDIEGR
jgi:hypothetical protein